MKYSLLIIIVLGFIIYLEHCDSSPTNINNNDESATTEKFNEEVNVKKGEKHKHSQRHNRKHKNKDDVDKDDAITKKPRRGKTTTSTVTKNFRDSGETMTTEIYRISTLTTHRANTYEYLEKDTKKSGELVLTTATTAEDHTQNEAITTEDIVKTTIAEEDKSNEKYIPNESTTFKEEDGYLKETTKRPDSSKDDDEFEKPTTQVNDNTDFNRKSSTVASSASLFDDDDNEIHTSTVPEYLIKETGTTRKKHIRKTTTSKKPRRRKITTTATTNYRDSGEMMTTRIHQVSMTTSTKPDSYDNVEKETKKSDELVVTTATAEYHTQNKAITTENTLRTTRVEEDKSNEKYIPNESTTFKEEDGYLKETTKRSDTSKDDDEFEKTTTRVNDNIDFISTSNTLASSASLFDDDAKEKHTSTVPEYINDEKGTTQKKHIRKTTAVHEYNLREEVTTRKEMHIDFEEILDAFANKVQEGMETQKIDSDTSKKTDDSDTHRKSDAYTDIATTDFHSILDEYANKVQQGMQAQQKNSDAHKKSGDNNLNQKSDIHTDIGTALLDTLNMETNIQGLINAFADKMQKGVDVQK